MKIGWDRIVVRRLGIGFVQERIVIVAVILVVVVVEVAHILSDECV